MADKYPSMRSYDNIRLVSDKKRIFFDIYIDNRSKKINLKICSMTCNDAWVGCVAVIRKALTMVHLSARTITISQAIDVM